MLNGDFVRVLVCCEIPIANVANINLGLNEIMVTSPHINLLVFFYETIAILGQNSILTRTCMIPGIKKRWIDGPTSDSRYQ